MLVTKRSIPTLNSPSESTESTPVSDQEMESRIKQEEIMESEGTPLPDNVSRDNTGTLNQNDFTEAQNKLILNQATIQKLQTAIKTAESAL